jgi:hypothetical protein
MMGTGVVTCDMPVHKIYNMVPLLAVSSAAMVLHLLSHAADAKADHFGVVRKQKAAPLYNRMLHSPSLSFSLSLCTNYGVVRKQKAAPLYNRLLHSPSLSFSLSLCTD